MASGSTSASGTTTGGLTDTSAQDQSDWSDLASQAGASTPGVGINTTIKAADAVFKNSAAAVNELNQQMGVYAKYLTDSKLNGISPVSNELGGTELTNIFNLKGTDILTGITGLQQILTNMEDTFIAALKAYRNAENKSSDDLNGIAGAAIKNDPNS